MKLREYQQRSVDLLRREYARGKRAPLLVCPTGAGKTVIAAVIIALSLQRAKRVLFCAGRVELLDQTVAKLALAGITDVRVIQADRDEGNPEARVVVASVPTLVTPRWLANLPPADLVIIDEAHHVLARTWNALSGFYSDAKLLGLTATPQRGDGRAMGDVFDALVVGATVRELMDLGHLVECRVFAPPQILGPRELALDPVDAYLKYVKDEQCVVFAQTIAHAHAISEGFNARGIAARCVTGKTRNREEALEAFSRGEFPILASVGVLVEGWDSPRTSAALLAKRFTHEGGYIQAGGRILRPHPTKTRATLVDLCGSALVHGTLDLPREFSLDGKGIAKERAPLRQCGTCGGVYVSDTRVDCAFCGAALPAMKRALPRATGAGLGEVSSSTPRRPWYVPMAAKRPGRCNRCSSPIVVGEKIVWAKGEGARHAECTRNGHADRSRDVREQESAA